MSDDKAQQEPSMEDILASIRRILSEDEVEEKAKEPEPVPEPAPPPAPPPAPEPPAATQDDIDAMFAAPPPPPPEPEPMPQDDIDAMFALPDPEPEPDDDILELTDDMVLDQPEPVPAFSLNDFVEEEEEEEDYPPPPPPPPPLPPPMPRRPAPAMDEDSLLSRPVSDRSTSLLSDLAREIVRQRGIGLGNGGITLEDMVRELLRPVLKEWLDQNLPYMIERIIKQEIEKMVNRAENL